MSVTIGFRSVILSAIRVALARISAFLGGPLPVGPAAAQSVPEVPQAPADPLPAVPAVFRSRGCAPAASSGPSRPGRGSRCQAACAGRLTAGDTVTATVLGSCRGGFRVRAGGAGAFLPVSECDGRRDTFTGRRLTVRVTGFGGGGRPVVSRRAVVISDGPAQAASLANGDIVEAVVTRVDGGRAVADLGSISVALRGNCVGSGRRDDRRLRRGARVKARVVRTDPERRDERFSLKLLGTDPWADFDIRAGKGTRLTGLVCSSGSEGLLVDVGGGVTGTVPPDEMAWDAACGGRAAVGDVIEVEVIGLDAAARSLTLSRRLCIESPWEAFSRAHGCGESLAGRIKANSPFGTFISLPGGVDGLVPAAIGGGYLPVGVETEVVITGMARDRNRPGRVRIELAVPGKCERGVDIFESDIRSTVERVERNGAAARQGRFETVRAA